MKYDVLSIGNGVNEQSRKNQIISKGSEGHNSVFKKIMECLGHWRGLIEEGKGIRDMV